MSRAETRDAELAAASRNSTYLQSHEVDIDAFETGPPFQASYLNHSDAHFLIPYACIQK
jgi:hypothetical protein